MFHFYSAIRIFSCLLTVGNIAAQELPTKSYRNTWFKGKKDFEWHYVAQISGNSVAVRTVKTVSHRDAFASVVGEMKWQGGAVFPSIEVTFIDGTTAKAKSGGSIRFETGKTVAAVAANFEHVGRSWSVTWGIGEPPSLSEFRDGRPVSDADIIRLRDLPAEKKRAYFRLNRESVLSFGKNSPDCKRFVRATDIKLDLETGIKTIGGASKSLVKGGENPPKDQLEKDAAELIRGIHSLQENAPTPPSLAYETAKAVKRINDAGTGIAMYLEKDPDVLDKVEGWTKAAKVVLSIEQFKEADEKARGEFISNVLDLGETANPATSIVGVFFRDLLTFKEKLWGNVTQQLNLVGDAIATERLDIERSQQLSREFEDTVRAGPWSDSTGKDAAKKWAEQIPIVGKLLSAFWD